MSLTMIVFFKKQQLAFSHLGSHPACQEWDPDQSAVAGAGTAVSRPNLMSLGRELGPAESAEGLTHVPCGGHQH